MPSRKGRFNFPTFDGSSSANLSEQNGSEETSEEIEMKSENLEDDVSDTTSDDDNDDEPERGYWNSKAEFILSCVGYAVGIGR